jgi:hypothetical protein
MLLFNETLAEHHRAIGTLREKCMRICECVFAIKIVVEAKPGPNAKILPKLDGDLLTTPVHEGAPLPKGRQQPALQLG